MRARQMSRRPCPRAGRRKPPAAWLVRALVCILLVADADPVSAQDGVAKPYSARYAVYRNGKLQARAEFLLGREDGNWIMKSESIGTHGMARLLKFRDYEYVEGTFEDRRFRPLSYVHELKWMGPNQDSSALFDWDNGFVEVTADGETVNLELTDGAVDPMSLQLEIRRRLAAGETRMEIMLVEEDEIELQTFRALPPERLETSLGCLDTRPVEKVREHSTRFTRSWHAVALDHIPIRMEHGKTDGDHMELRITELVMAGRVVDPLPGCAASQDDGH